MAAKPFSVRLYNDDDNAKNAWIDWLTARGYIAVVNPDQYGVDVIAHKDGKNYQFEVEVKHNWKGPRFQYDTLHYSERKRKFLDSPADTAFVTFNHERTHALVVSGLALSEAPTIVKNTIYTQNEKFIEVMASQCELINLEVTDGN